MRRHGGSTCRTDEHPPFMQLPQSLSRLASLGEAARSDRWIKSLPLWVSIALVVVLAWQLVQIAWTLIGARQVTGGGPAGAAAVPIPGGPALDVAGIVNAHLFGVAG